LVAGALALVTGALVEDVVDDVCVDVVLLVWVLLVWVLLEVDGELSVVTVVSLVDGAVPVVIGAL
jgi:hypothetical protein